MNALLKTNFLRNQNTILNSIQLGSFTKQSLPSLLPNDASTLSLNSLKHLKSIDLIHNTSNSIHCINRPSHALSLFKDFALINPNNRFNYYSKIPNEQDKDKDKDSSIKEEDINTADEDIKSNIEGKKSNNSKPSKNISLEDFNQIKKELDIQMKKTDDLNAKFHQLRKAYLDNLSESDSIKNRHQRELKVIKDYAIGNFGKDLVDVHDNFLRALDIVKDINNIDKESNDKKEKMFNSFIEGIRMVNSTLSKTFTKHGIIEFTPKIKDKFDPHYHEAIYDYEDPLLDSGSIGKVMCSGFKLGNRILRPAKVGIIKKKAN